MSKVIEALTETVRGRVITPSDSDYDDARAVYNAMHDRKPRAVIQCVDSADVMAAVAAGRGNFGVVTSFQFQLHEVGDIVGGPLFYEFDDAAAVLERYREFIADAPAIRSTVRRNGSAPATGATSTSCPATTTTVHPQTMAPTTSGSQQ